MTYEQVNMALDGHKPCLVRISLYIIIMFIARQQKSCHALTGPVYTENAFPRTAA